MGSWAQLSDTKGTWLGLRNCKANRLEGMLLDQYWQPLFPGPGNLQDPVMYLSIGEGVVSFFSKELEKTLST